MKSDAVIVTDTPRTAPAAQLPPPRRLLHLRFLVGGHQDFFLDELGPILRHPYLVSYYCASVLLTLAVSIQFGPAATGLRGVTLLLPILVFATLIGIGSFVAWIHALARLRPRTNPLPVLLSFPLALSILATQLTTVLLWNIVLGVPADSVTAMLMTVALVYTFDEVVICTFLRNMAKRIVEDVRSLHGTPPARRSPARPATAPDGPQLAANGTMFPVESVLRLQAQGNYVQIWTDAGTLHVPGPFSTLLRQLPETLGCVVHRSEWVATRAVVSARREGRATVLILSNGTTVRVASTRAGLVRDWLARFTPKPARRSPQSTGGGDTKRQSRPLPDTTTSAIGGTAPSAPKASATPTNN